MFLLARRTTQTQDWNIVLDLEYRVVAAFVYVIAQFEEEPNLFA